MDDLTSRFPALFQLLGAYLHQDWLEDASSPEAAVRQYIAEHARGEIDCAAAEIQALLESTTEEQALSAALLELGCYYAPVRDGRTPSGWLREVAGMLRDR